MCLDINVAPSSSNFVKLLCNLHLRPVSVPLPNPCSRHGPLGPQMSALASGCPWLALRGAPYQGLCSSGSCRDNHGVGSKSSAGRALGHWVFTAALSPEASPEEGRLSLRSSGPGSSRSCFEGRLCPYPGHRLGML